MDCATLRRFGPTHRTHLCPELTCVGDALRRRLAVSLSRQRSDTPTQVGETCVDPPGAVRSDGQTLQTGGQVRQS